MPKKQERYRRLPKFILRSPKHSTKVSYGLTTIIVFSCIYGFIKGAICDAEVLRRLLEFCIVTVLSMVALGISVFQTDNNLISIDERNCIETQRKLYLKYIFSMFPVILILVLGYLISLIFENHSKIIGLYSGLVILAMTHIVVKTMIAFITFLNIKN